MYSEVGKLYNQNKQALAEDKLKQYAEWLSGFTLKTSSFINVGKTFRQRFNRNQEKEIEQNRSGLRQVTRFYIPDLDELNNGRNLRGQLSCFLASTGVGKSHIAKYIGIQANIVDGLHVLHFQLEGSEEEALNAYSGGLVSKNAFYFERGRISELEMKRFEQMVESYSGSITVRTFPRFNTRVSSLSDKFSGTGHPAKAHNTSALFEILFEAGKTATPSIFVLSHAITRSIILLVIYTWLNASTTKSFEQ